MKKSFYNLTPQKVMSAVEQAGFSPTGEYLQLNSYENRVFDIRLEKNSERALELNHRVIAKFYRPGRWSLPAIQEEYHFLTELKESGIEVVSPLSFKDNTQLHKFEDLWVAFFPKIFGRSPQELSLSDYKKIGTTLARIHLVGQSNNAHHRLKFSAQTMGWPALKLLESWVFPEVWPRYHRAAKIILDNLDQKLEQCFKLRIHGDCHKGNLLCIDAKDSSDNHPEFYFLDFDDFGLGPAVQDFWMLFSGDNDSTLLNEEEQSLLSGYMELRHFDMNELKLIPQLRGLRIIHYAAWIARRWDDPSFPRLFPAFQEYNYWAQEVEQLEKIAWSL